NAARLSVSSRNSVENSPRAILQNRQSADIELTSPLLALPIHLRGRCPAPSPGPARPPDPLGQQESVPARNCRCGLGLSPHPPPPAPQLPAPPRNGGTAPLECTL